MLEQNSEGYPGPTNLWSHFTPFEKASHYAHQAAELEHDAAVARKLAATLLGDYKPTARDLLTLPLDVRGEMMRAAGQMEVQTDG